MNTVNITTARQNLFQLVANVNKWFNTIKVYMKIQKNFL